jgi:ABC-2 type transport system permease protein
MSDQARILDRGYRSYDGARGGVADAIRVVTLFSFGRVLGIGRGIWAKILPIATIAIAFIPAIVFVGMAALIPDELAQEGLPTYGEYYGFVTAAIVIFTAFAAPELLCPDRRSRMIALYLSSALDRMTYLAAKGLAALTALGIVTIGPPMLLLIAYTFQGTGPDDIGGFADLLWRVLVAGIVIAAVHTSLSLAISSLTDRNGIASAAVILTLLLSNVVASVLVDGAGGPDELRSLDLMILPFELAARVFDDVAPTWPEVSTGFLVVANLGWTALFLGIVVWRYQRIEVTR